MSRHRYSARVLAGDYLRAGSGLALTAGPIVLLEPAAVVGVILGALAVLFGAFALRTALRQLTVIEITADGVRSTGPVSCHISWRGVTRLRLDYFSTRRELQRGWMQLKITGRHSRIRIDSTIDGFEQIAAAAAKAAGEYAIPLNDSAAANFEALGIAAQAGKREMAA